MTDVRPSNLSRWTGARQSKQGLANANHDLVAGFVTLAAIVLFTTHGNIVADSLNSLSGGAGPRDKVLATAVVLNIALILFGWRRYNDLRSEVVERTAAEAAARELANRDPLTGLLNRRSLHVEGERLISQARIVGNEVVAYLLDLDNFKYVNDAHGHATGDGLLVQVAARVSGAFPGDTLIARLGGDEFVALLPLSPLGMPDQAEAIADRLAHQLSSAFVVDGHTVHIGASVGLAQMDDGFGRVDALVRRADLAMYAAKKAGRNQFAWFKSDMERQVRQRGMIEQGIRRGLPLGEFVPFFEPQVDLSTGRICGFEILARWQSPHQGLVAPDQFIPVAEENGLIAELSTTVARAGLLAARDWDPSLTYAINLSPSQLRDPWLAQKLVQMLAETGFPPERLEIEITETCVFENTALADTTIRSLKNQGVSIALDDFGTGFSSLSHLRALPLDRIKVDRGFVTTMAENANSLAIITAISRLADSLSLPVTAEGIEVQASRDLLAELGVQRGQGWLFGHAASTTATARLLSGEVEQLHTARVG